MSAVHVRLPERLRQVALRLGGGNLRAGIAASLELAEKQIKQEYDRSGLTRRGE